MKNALLISSTGIVVVYLMLLGAIFIGSGEPMESTIAMSKGYILGCAAWYGGLGIVWTIRQARRLPQLKKIKKNTVAK